VKYVAKQLMDKNGLVEDIALENAFPNIYTEV